MSAPKKPTIATPATYRGPDRRSGEDRRQAGEQRQPEDRRDGIERRSKARGALWAAVDCGEDVSTLLSYKLAPLLALCEFTATAHHTLSEFAHQAHLHRDLSERLRSIDPEWQTALTDGAIARHIGQCMGLARDLCEQAAGMAQMLANDAAQAMQDVDEGGAHD